MTIDRAVKVSFEAGYDVQFIFENQKSFVKATYKLTSSGKSFEKAIRIGDYASPDCAILTGGPLDILGHSILETLKKEKVSA